MLLRTLFCVIVLAADGRLPESLPREFATTRVFALASPLSVINSVVLVLPDSIRTKIFTALAAGDIDGAATAYMAHKGLTEAPKWLQAFQAAFNVANRRAGACQQVAKDIFTAFGRFGSKVEYIAFKAREGREFMVFDLQDGTSPTITRSGYHVVVRGGERIYDAFTGPSGMLMSDYMRRLHAPNGYDWSVVVNP